MNDCSENECQDRIYDTPIKVPKLPQSEAFIDPTNVVNKQELADAKAEFNSAIEEIKANPDVVDIVANKAGLDAYDTAKLTDEDIVKVLKDETEGDVTSYYRWDGSKFTLVGKLDKYTVEHITSDKGTSRIENHEDGGVMTMVTKDNKWGGLCVNDGSDDLLVEAYAVDGSNTTGTRIIMNEKKAYYTKDKANTTKTDNEEIATVETVTTAVKAAQTAVEAKIDALTAPKVLTKDNIYNTPGTFLFTGNSDSEGTFPTTGCDWVGIQMANGADAFQIVGTNQHGDGTWGLWFRACDTEAVSEATTKDKWTKWDRMIVGTEFDKLKARVEALEAPRV